MTHVYTRVENLPDVPLKLVPQDVLKDMLLWYVDLKNGDSMMIGSNGEELLRVYDCLYLMNLSENDQKILKAHWLYSVVKTGKMKLKDFERSSFIVSSTRSTVEVVC